MFEDGADQPAGAVPPAQASPVPAPADLAASHAAPADPAAKHRLAADREALRLAADQLAAHAAAVNQIPRELTVDQVPVDAPGSDPAAVYARALDVAKAQAQLVAAAQAKLLANLLVVAELAPVAEFAAMELAGEFAWSQRGADTRLALAETLIRRLPDVHTAMLNGLEDVKVKVIVDGVAALELGLARTIAAKVLPQAAGLTPGELRARLRKLVITADPGAAVKRHRKQVTDRRVELHDTGDSCANLFGLNLPADEALAASNRINTIAQALKRAGDPRSMDQLRADTFLDLLKGTFAYPTSGGVELTAPLDTLTRLANQPGDLAGYGPVIADIARQVAERQRKSPWTFTIRDEATGEIFTGATRRRPNTALARYIRARDRKCRAPGCRRPGLYADIDHTIAVQDGGQTVPENLGLLCRYHHRAKHEGWWLLVQVKAGVFVWQSPLGRRYVVYPAAP